MPDAMPWYIPLVIFFARIGDVSISTVRTMMMVNGSRVGSALLGACEATIWVLAVGGVLKYLPDPWAVVGYAAGYGTGIFVGVSIEDRLAMGFRLVRVISTSRDLDVAGALRQHGYGVTRFDGVGRDGPVTESFIVIRRKSLRQLRRLVSRIAPDAFVTVERMDHPVGGVLHRHSAQPPKQPPQEPRGDQSAAGQDHAG
jgi:uncharacterized protein YebE (UPF0316 family)